PARARARPRSPGARAAPSPRRAREHRPAAASPDRTPLGNAPAARRRLDGLSAIADNRGVRSPQAKAASAPAETVREVAADLTPVVGANLKRFRAERGFFLERLAKASGV